MQKSNRGLPPLATSYCSTIYSTSTSGTDLSSPAVSSRVLYHESAFGLRPMTSRSLPPPIEDRPAQEDHRRHYHTNSAETYTSNQKDIIDSNWHFGRNMNHGQQQLDSNHFKMTGGITTEEEFDALPLAVRRKFFSTLERLRFAQHLNESSLHQNKTQSDRPLTHERRALSRRGSLPGRRSASIAHINYSKPKTQRRLRKSVIYPPDQIPCPALPDAPGSPRTWFKTLPEKIQQSQFSKEEQIALAGRLKEGRGNRGRESVILDAADEAMWKASYHRHANRTKIKEIERPRGSPLPESLRSSMDSMHDLEKSEDIVKEDGYEKETEILDPYNAYDSFRWLDEEPDLDLSLNSPLDEYHANLTGTFNQSSSSSNRRPSFRRHLSISKIPFGANTSTRTSVNSPTSPRPLLTNRTSTHWAAPPTKSHESKKSRALSLMPLSKQSGTKHDDVGAYDDPNTSHWQDPDARLKLRVYLASPQKFDEAIEFGFPSLNRDTVSTPLSDNKENRAPFGRKASRDSSRFRHGGGGSHGTTATFLNDDEELIFGDEDDTSMIDPDSPKTPLEISDSYNLAHHRKLTSPSISNLHGRFASKTSRTSSSLSGSVRVSRERNDDERDYTHLGITKPILHKRADTDGFLGLASGGGEGRGYMHQQLGPGNREMTLRMTLTRPDLRTDIPPLVPEKDSTHRPAQTPSTDRTRLGSVDRSEKNLYNGMGIGNLGWQNAGTQTVITAGKQSVDVWEEKYDIVGMKGPFGGHDGWGPEKEEGGVVKRFWKKVKSQKKG